MKDTDDRSMEDRTLALASPQGGQLVPLPAPRQHFSEDEEGIDPRQLLRIIGKRKWVVLSVIAIFVVTAALSAALTIPVYRATAVMEINHETSRILRIQDFSPTANSLPAIEQFYNTQYEILRGRALSEDTVRTQGVETHPELTGEIRQRSLMGELYGLSWTIRQAFRGRSDADESQASPDPEQLREMAIRRAGAALRGRIQVTPQRGSRLVHVGVSSFDPVFAARMANAVVEQYIRSNMQRRYDAGNDAREFLQTQLDEMRVSLERADQALIDFAVEHQVTDLEERLQTAALSLRELNARLNETNSQLIQYETYRDQIQAGRSAQLSNVIETEAIQALRQQLVQLHTERAGLAQRFKADYPALVELQTRIDQIQAEINDQVGQGVQRIGHQYENLKAQVEALQRAITDRETSIMALNQQGVQYNILKREFETNQELYSGLLQRMKEIGLAAGLEENNIAIIDPALPIFAPYHPNMSRSVLVALLLGALIGIGLALLLEFLDTTIRRMEDLERITGRPVLGLVPVAGTKERGLSLRPKGYKPVPGVAHFSVTHVKSAVSEAYRSVRTSLMFSTPKGMPKTLLITSPAPAAGKTTTAVNLATVLAQNGARVLVIDADLRRPRLHVEFASRQSPGLTNRITATDVTGNKTSSIIGTKVPGMFIMPSGSHAPNPAELLGSRRMRQIIQESAKVFDCVIVDSAPILGLADSVLLSRMVEGVIMVVSAGQTSKDSFKNAIKRLELVNAHLLGLILNQVDLDSPEYHYYRSDYYGYGYAPGVDDPAQRTPAKQNTAKDGNGIGGRLRKA